MNNLAKTIDVLEDGKLSVFTFNNEEIYIQPKIIVDTLDDNLICRVRGEDGNVVNVDVTCEEIDGVAFAGSFAALETALREMANKANRLSEGGSATPSTPTPVERTTGLFRSTSAGSVAAGAKEISIYNAGVANGIVKGAILKPGERITWTAPYLDTLDVVAYDATGTDFLISNLV